MNKLGIVLNNIGQNQPAYYAIKNSNKILKERQDLSIIIFYFNMTPQFISAQFGVMQISEAWGFDGTLISTDLQTTKKSLIMPAPKKKIFYVWDLEWLRGLTPNSYEEMAEVYQHPEIELVARSDSHKDAIENAWNRPVKKIISDFNMEEMLDL